MDTIVPDHAFQSELGLFTRSRLPIPDVLDHPRLTENKAQLVEVIHRKTS
jgi:hypothetical protein